ncbi:hypothetical protein TNCV_3895201 [Trichonephila clavipes]|nr:hypothetical protein TNCV_3895201 [Trichonephila clavipes]
MAGKHLKEQQPFSGLSEKLKQLCALCDEKISNDERIKKKLYIDDDFKLKHEKHIFNTDEGFDEYQSVHAGREMEVGKLNLHGDDRRNLAALLKAGVPSTKIIEDIQNKCLPTERLGLLTKKDLHDVSHSFKLDKTVLLVFS